jgi:plasmid stability protein
MPNVLVREVDNRDLELLKRRAQASGRSLQAELKRILELAARASDEKSQLGVWQSRLVPRWPDDNTQTVLI